MPLQSTGLLGTIAAELAAEFLSQQTHRSLLGLLARLPELDNSRYLELRLGESRGQVDYLMSLTQRQAQMLARSLSSSDGPGMEAVRRLGEHWTPTAPPALRAIPSAWLEFDDVAHQEAPAASVCVCVAPTYRDPYAPIPAQPPGELLDTIVEWVRALRQQDPGSDQRQVLRRCIDALPDGARWIHLSLMSARDPVALKLYGVFPADTLLRYLQEIAWPGTLTTFSQFLRRFHSPEQDGEEIYLDFPLAAFEDRPGAGLGLCFSQQQLRGSERRRSGDPARASLLKALVRDGACTSVQAAALAEWVARPAATISSADGRAALPQAALQIDRWLDLKLVYHDARPLLAKAYLGFARRRTGFGFGPLIPEPHAPIGPG